MTNDHGVIEIDGFGLRYRFEGHGIPMLVVGSTMEHPRMFSANLRRHVQMIFLDHRGFTTLPAGVDPMSVDLATIIDDIEHMRRALGLTRFAIAGHSAHSYMALEYAKRHPEHVSHVVMICIAPSAGPQTIERARRHWEEFASPERKAQLAENYRRMPDDRLALLPANERVVEAGKRFAPVRYFDYRFDPTELLVDIETNAVIDHVWGQVFPTLDITENLREFDRPVFLALGRYDFLMGPPSIWDPIRQTSKI